VSSIAKPLENVTVLDTARLVSLRLRPCETSHKRDRVCPSTLLLCVLLALAPVSAWAQPGAPPPPPPERQAAPGEPGTAQPATPPVEPTAGQPAQPHDQPAAASSPQQPHGEPSAAPTPQAHGAPTAQGHGEAAGHEAAGHEEEHAESLLSFIARLANFAILAGFLYYVLRKPLGTYLVNRSTQINGDLVTAKETTATATKELAEIDRKLQALPAEIAALKTRGTQEIAAEETRIRQTAEAERHRLIEQTRREIDLQVRLAKRELTEHAASLAVALAADKIVHTITPDDQSRLIDRYVTQVRNVHD
jgi:F-type H+-transporting ATPase subunit b